MIDYIGTLPMIVQLIIIVSILLIIISFSGVMIYRLARYGMKFKASIGKASAEIDATDETEVKPL